MHAAAIWWCWPRSVPERKVIADGDIHIYGSLRGRALAGAHGQRDARIFVRSMQARLLSIAGIWRTLGRTCPLRWPAGRCKCCWNRTRLSCGPCPIELPYFY